MGQVGVCVDWNMSECTCGHMCTYSSEGPLSPSVGWCSNGCRPGIEYAITDPPERNTMSAVESEQVTYQLRLSFTRSMVQACNAPACLTTPTSFAPAPTPTGKLAFPILFALMPSIHLNSDAVATIQYTPFAFAPFIATRSRSGDAVNSSPVVASTTVRVVRLVKLSIGGRVRMFGSTDQLP